MAGAVACRYSARGWFNASDSGAAEMIRFTDATRQAEGGGGEAGRGERREAADRAAGRRCVGWPKGRGEAQKERLAAGLPRPPLGDTCTRSVSKRLRKRFDWRSFLVAPVNEARRRERRFMTGRPRRAPASAGVRPRRSSMSRARPASPSRPSRMSSITPAASCPRRGSSSKPPSPASATRPTRSRARLKTATSQQRRHRHLGHLQSLFQRHHLRDRDGMRAARPHGVPLRHAGRSRARARRRQGAASAARRRRHPGDVARAAAPTLDYIEASACPASSSTACPTPDSIRSASRTGEAMALLIGHLASLGHRRIGFIAGHPGFARPSSASRLQVGARRATGLASIPRCSPPAARRPRPRRLDACAVDACRSRRRRWPPATI